MATKRSKKSVKSASSSAPAAGSPATIAVYVILGLLVVGTSFYTGFLFGQSSDGPKMGGSNGGGVDTVQIVEFSDFQCPFCQRAVPTIEQLKAQYGDKVEITYKHFPLESIHPNAFNSALAAECVRKEGGDEAFWKYHDTLFANQGALDAASLKQYASTLGFDIGSCLDNQETAATVRADMAEAQQRGVSGTPSFWIQDELVVGAVPFAQLAAVVDQKLAGAPAAPAAPAAQQPSAPQPGARVDVDAGDYVMGDADAPVLLVEFTDYQCPFCQRAHQQSFPQIKANYIDTGKVRYTVRHYPLPMHPDAPKASEAVECAGEQGKFFEMHNTLFDNQGSIGVAAIKGYAVTLGLDAAQFNSCLDSGKYTAKVQADLEAGQQAGVSGTPSFFVNGMNIVGAQPYSAFQAAIEAELQ